jgi:hypothetical protein
MQNAILIAIRCATVPEWLFQSYDGPRHEQRPGYALRSRATPTLLNATAHQERRDFRTAAVGRGFPAVMNEDDRGPYKHLRKSSLALSAE